MATWRHRRPSVVGTVAPWRPTVRPEIAVPTGTLDPRRPRRAANGAPGGVSARPRSGRSSRWRRAAGPGLTTTRRSDPERRPVGGRASGGSRRHRTRRDEPELRPPHRRPSCSPRFPPRLPTIRMRRRTPTTIDGRRPMRTWLPLIGLLLLSSPASCPGPGHQGPQRPQGVRGVEGLDLQRPGRGRPGRQGGGQAAAGRLPLHPVRGVPGVRRRRGPP